jgi:hypothetical protein
LGEWSGLDSHYGECKDDADNGEMKYNRRDDDQDLNQRQSARANFVDATLIAKKGL